MTNPLTHLLWGYSLSHRISVEPRHLVLGLAMAVLPDLDGLPLPGLEHHGPLHTPLFALALALVVLVITRSRTVAIISLLNLMVHLVLDTVGTGSPVMWLYPASDAGIALGTEVSLGVLIAVKGVLFAVPLLYILKVYRDTGTSPLDLVRHVEGRIGGVQTYILLSLLGLFLVYIAITEYLVHVI
jgi:hypothetical protein